MSLKLPIILLIYFMFFSGVISVDILSKYGSKNTNKNFIYLEVHDFKVDEKIYIELTVYESCSYPYLYYKFYKDIDNYIVDDDSFSTAYSSSTTYIQTPGSYKEKYYFEIKKSSSEYNYLFMVSACHPPLNFENTKHGDSTTTIIIAVVCSVVGLTIIITIIVCCIRRCRRARIIGAFPHPVLPVNGVNPYPAQPVTCVGMAPPVANAQPYAFNPNYVYNPNVNPNYNQTFNYQNIQSNTAAPIQQPSEIIINQDKKDEKPQ